MKQKGKNRCNGLQNEWHHRGLNTGGGRAERVPRAVGEGSGPEGRQASNPIRAVGEVSRASPCTRVPYRGINIDREA